MKITYTFLIRSLSSGKYYFNSTTSMGDYFIPNGQLATRFSSIEEAENMINDFGFEGSFEVVSVINKTF